jgi:hypothetical protein
MISEYERICRYREGQSPICDLKHILNNCTHFLGDYTKRHNAVVGVIRDLIENTVRPEKIYLYREVSIHGDETRNGGLYKTKHRPDLWYWRETETEVILELIEVKVPWGSTRDETNGEVINNFEVVERKGKDKYKKIKT